MAHLLHHRVGKSFLDDVSLPRPSLITLVSACGTHHADRSFLLIRERSTQSTAGHRVLLRGLFDEALNIPLQKILATVAHLGTPLTFDLQEVTYLDQSCLRLLLRARRDHSRVVFHLPTAGPVAQMAASLGILPKPIALPRSMTPTLPGSRFGKIYSSIAGLDSDGAGFQS